MVANHDRTFEAILDTLHRLQLDIQSDVDDLIEENAQLITENDILKEKVYNLEVQLREALARVNEAAWTASS